MCVILCLNSHLLGLIDPGDSLFTYPTGLTAANYSFPNHMPDFVDEVTARASSDVQEQCGGNTRCIFDATQTGNLEIGINTMVTDEINEEDQMIASQ